MSKNKFGQFLQLISVFGVLSGYPIAAGETLMHPVGLVPKPVKVEVGTGSFHLSPECNILFQKGSPGAKSTAIFLAETVRRSAGFSFPVREAGGPGKGCILITTAEADPALGKEGYRLEVTPEQVVIRAPQAAGLFYGVQTLRQLLPAETFGSKRSANQEKLRIPCVRIEDLPRFEWRGMHLDVSRHFFDVAFVKRYLDQLAMHKINVFHWHLTDDDGWRVEIKKYPKLTRVGAWRGPDEALPPSYESGEQRYGGFYTQRQIREIVSYAAERHILVVPEVDVPAHCRAAIVAYPELLCAGDPYQFKSAQEVVANVLCPSQEKTCTFVEGVFGELADLFPGPYIHMGGDERPNGPWEQCERCQKRMREEHLANGNILQDRFLKRQQDFLKTRGKKAVGWDELDHETVLRKDYTVMAWNSVEAGIAAAKKGYPVIMAPSPFTYFDLAYSEDPAEPGQRWAGVLPLEKSYSFDPAPANLSPDVARRILGVHGCLWSEMLFTPERPDYMGYPRICALAEIGWTPQSQRKWPEFWLRLCTEHLPRLDAARIAYRVPPPSARKDGTQITILLPYEGARVRYTLDGSEPDSNSTLYSRPFDLPKDGVLKMRTFRPNGRASRIISGTER
jgi:hexosaminidase